MDGAHRLEALKDGNVRGSMDNQPVKARFYYRLDNVPFSGIDLLRVGGHVNQAASVTVPMSVTDRVHQCLSLLHVIGSVPGSVGMTANENNLISGIRNDGKKVDALNLVTLISRQGTMQVLSKQQLLKYCRVAVGLFRMRPAAVAQEAFELLPKFKNLHWYSSERVWNKDCSVSTKFVLEMLLAISVDAVESKRGGAVNTGGTKRQRSMKEGSASDKLEVRAGTAAARLHDLCRNVRTILEKKGFPDFGKASKLPTSKSSTASTPAPLRTRLCDWLSNITANDIAGHDLSPEWTKRMQTILNNVKSLINWAAVKKEEYGYDASVDEDVRSAEIAPLPPSDVSEKDTGDAAPTTTSERKRSGRKKVATSPAAASTRPTVGKKSLKQRPQQEKEVEKEYTGGDDVDEVMEDVEDTSPRRTPVKKKKTVKKGSAKTGGSGSRKSGGASRRVPDETDSSEEEEEDEVEENAGTVSEDSSAEVVVSDSDDGLDIPMDSLPDTGVPDEEEIRHREERAEALKEVLAEREAERRMRALEFGSLDKPEDWMENEFKDLVRMPEWVTEEGNKVEEEGDAEGFVVTHRCAQGIAWTNPKVRSEGLREVTMETPEEARGSKRWWHGYVKCMEHGKERFDKEEIRLLEDVTGTFSRLAPSFKVMRAPTAEDVVDMAYIKDFPCVAHSVELQNADFQRMLRLLGFRPPHRSFFVLNKHDLEVLRRFTFVGLMWEYEALAKLVASVEGDVKESAITALKEVTRAACRSRRAKLDSAGFIVFEGMLDQSRTRSEWYGGADSSPERRRRRSWAGPSGKGSCFGV